MVGSRLAARTARQGNQGKVAAAARAETTWAMEEEEAVAAAAAKGVRLEKVEAPLSACFP
jgi:hypothetical protein